MLRAPGGAAEIRDDVVAEVNSPTFREVLVGARVTS